MQSNHSKISLRNHNNNNYNYKKQQPQSNQDL